MKLSTKTRYATRAMLYLALHYGQGPINVREIADDQQLSLKYLEQLMAALRTAGLIRSVRGAQGGHTLAKPPDQINLREIYQALEGLEQFVDCSTDPNICDRAVTCATREVWARMYEECMQMLQSITLEDLVQRAKEKQSLLPIVYQI